MILPKKGCGVNLWFNVDQQSGGVKFTVAVMGLREKRVIYLHILIDLRH